MKLKVFLHNAPKTRIGVSLISITLGGAIIGIASPIVFTNVDFFFGFSQAFTTGGGDGAFAAAATSLVAAAAGGGLMVGGGLIGLGGHFAKSQALLVIFLILTFVGSLVAVVGAGIFLQVPGMVGEKIYIDDTNSINPPLQGVQRDMNDFMLAIFNECCIARNWTDQRQAGVCTGNNAVDCPVMTDPIVTSNIPNAQVLLCACAYSGDKLAAFRASIQSTGFCAKGTKARINVAGLTLPDKVPGRLTVPFLTNQRYNGFVYSTIPLIGYHRIPAENPDQENARSLPLPFGCGLGYQKGIAWLTDVWFQQNAVGPAYGCLAVGLINIGLMITAIAISIIQDQEESDMAVGRVDKWGAVQDIPANFAHTNPVQQAPIAAYAGAPMVNHGGGSNNSSAHNSVAAAPDHEEYFIRLREFYAIYDKDKSIADVEDVAKWTSLHGVDAINAKLMNKYKADLNTMSKPTGLGAKALQNDLDF